MRASSSECKKKIVIILFITILLAVTTVLVYAWKKGERLRFVDQLGNGINLGNTLDATNLRDYKPDASELDYETFWGNPEINQAQLRAIRKAGFRTVRIPITIEDHLDEELRISDVWMDRITDVIDMALAEDLYVIMDLHGDEAINLQLSRKDEVTSYLQSVWKQLAVHFKDYNERLLFEGMNEPRLRDSEYEWNEATPELRDFVNELNLAFIETVRNTGGNNEDRYLLICPYCNGAWADTVQDLVVPEGNIIVAVHIYRPYQFCQNREGTDQWSIDIEEDTREAEDAFTLLNSHYINNGIPVIFTEYGCVDKDNIDERTEWAIFYRELSSEYRIPLIWWDNGSTYQILDREKCEWLYPDFVTVLTSYSRQR